MRYGVSNEPPPSGVDRPNKYRSGNPWSAKENEPFDPGQYARVAGPGEDHLLSMPPAKARVPSLSSASTDVLGKSGEDGLLRRDSLLGRSSNSSEFAFQAPPYSERNLCWVGGLVGG